LTRDRERSGHAPVLRRCSPKRLADQDAEHDIAKTAGVFGVKTEDRGTSTSWRVRQRNKIGSRKVNCAPRRVLPGCFWDRSHHRFDRSGRSRNPTRGSVGFTRGLSSTGARSTSEFVSRPPNSPAWPSWIFLVLLMRRGRVTRCGNMGKPLSRGMGGPGAADCASEPQRREPLGKGPSRGSPRLPLHETKFFRWEGSYF
jgi:hypothetical protein